MTTSEAVATIKAHLAKGMELERKASKANWLYQPEGGTDAGLFHEARVYIDGDRSWAKPERTVALIRCGLRETTANGQLIPLTRNQYPILARLVEKLIPNLPCETCAALNKLGLSGACGRCSPVIQAAEELQKGTA